MKTMKLMLAAAAVLGSASLAIPEASAMPVAPVAPTTAASDAGLQQVVLVCGPFRCVRRFGYYRRPFVRGYYGYRRPYFRRRFF